MSQPGSSNIHANLAVTLMEVKLLSVPAIHQNDDGCNCLCAV